MRRRTVLASFATFAATAGCSGRDDPSGEQAALSDDCPTTPADSPELPERGKQPESYPEFPAELGLESALEFARSVEETYQHNWSHEEVGDVEVDHSGSSVSDHDGGFAATVEGTASVAAGEQTEGADESSEERDYVGRYYIDETLVRRGVGENTRPDRESGVLLYCRE